MAPPGDQTPETIKKQNGIDDIPVFYLQGGFDIEKLRGINKFMMKMMESMVVKKLEGKQDKTESEADMLEMFKHGGDRVKEENLDEVVDYLKNKDKI